MGLPHMEADQQIEALQFLQGDTTVRLLDADKELNALLLERCEPGPSPKTGYSASPDKSHPKGETVTSHPRRASLRLYS
ncbi:MAG: hypothetical protein FJ194_01645 [Gammaproteobacteria bacterium]|nr:hypothetical protein [Gammaproteobacteria bacterium]